jgi:hypothetical protein
MGTRAHQKVIGFAAVAFLGSLALVESFNWLRWSESRIQNMLLAETPVASSKSEVARFIRGRNWSSERSHREEFGIPKGGGKLVGSSSIKVYLGSYQDIPFRAHVVAYWGFDEDGRLIEIWVRKEWDGI